MGQGVVLELLSQAVSCHHQPFSGSRMLPGMAATSVSVPRVSHTCPLPLQETLQGQQVGLAQALNKLLLLLCVLVYMECCICL